MRTVIYARYSSHAQNSLSTAQQVTLCSERAAREGWPVVGVFADDAISGAAGIDEAARPQLAMALAMIEAGEADQLLAESTDRVARHQGDAFAVRERLEYAGARLFTLLDGAVDDITGTIKGLFDARFRKDLAARVRRGQRGSVEQGRSPAGLAYGYRLANRLDERGAGMIRGLREVAEEQAETVRRIFRDYAAGASPREIARALNADGVPGPRGGAWTISTIAGDRKRGNGILRNRLYAGQLVHGRTSKRADPKTRASRIRANGEETWLVSDVPALRIVEQGLWEEVQRRRERFEGMPPEQARRAKHLLSGKVVCGTCGGRVIVVGRGQWGCGRAKAGTGCTNTRRIMGYLLEERVLGGLQEQMLHPDVVSAFVAEYHRDFARRSAELRRSRTRLTRRRDEAAAKVTRLIDAIADPRLADIGEIAAALQAVKAERDSLATELADIDLVEKRVVALHPGLPGEYRRQIEALAAALAEGEEARREALPVIQGLIDTVTLTPRAEARGVHIEVGGRLAALLALATGEKFEATQVNGGAGSGNRTRVTSLEG